MSSRKELGEESFYTFLIGYGTSRKSWVWDGLHNSEAHKQVEMKGLQAELAAEWCNIHKAPGSRPSANGTLQHLV